MRRANTDTRATHLRAISQRDNAMATDNTKWGKHKAGAGRRNSADRKPETDLC